MSSLAAVSAAQKLGGSITGFVAGSNVKAVAEHAAKVDGLEKVIYVDNAAYDKVCPTCLVLSRNPSNNKSLSLHRASPKTTPLSSSKTSKRAASATSSLATLPLART